MFDQICLFFMIAINFLKVKNPLDDRAQNYEAVMIIINDRSE